jgi:hypothetical protein
VAAPLSPDKIWGLYKIAIDEYRLEVKLGWDRAMYCVVFNSAIISVAAGLLKLESAPLVYVFIAGTFVLGFFTSLMGIRAIAKSHEYYRRTVVKKTLIEDILGLTAPLAGYPRRHTLTIGTTAGQEECLRILYDSENWMGRPLRRSSITFWFTSLLRLIAAINIAGIFVALYLSSHAPAKLREPRPTLIVSVANRASIRHRMGIAAAPGTDASPAR